MRSVDSFMDVSAAHLVNDGLITLNGQALSPEERTIVATGVARSGTSMLAQLLDTAGVFMGLDLDEVVFEDHAVADAFASPDSGMLSRLIASRNEQAAVWGFKRPHLFNGSFPALQGMLRNPRFIITYRDPVAIAKRNGISEHFDARPGLRAAAADMLRCMDFTLGLTCPVLLVSYEKALLRPVALVEELIAFCGVDVAGDRRSRMVATVKANREEYIRSARRLFQGYVDHIKDGFLSGWCWQIGVPTPLVLDVSIGTRPHVAVVADGFRADLAGAKVGSGYHAFHLDMSELASNQDEAVIVRVQGRLFQLSGSGRTIRELSR